MDDLIEWVKEQKVFPKVYWRERGREFAGAGEKSRLSSVLEPTEERYFGGMAFTADHKNDPLWRSFPRSYFFAPLISREQEARELKKSSQKPKLTQRCDLPSYDAWAKEIDHALAAIHSKKFEKVVLARRTTLTFDER